VAPVFSEIEPLRRGKESVTSGSTEPLVTLAGQVSIWPQAAVPALLRMRFVFSHGEMAALVLVDLGKEGVELFGGADDSEHGPIGADKLSSFRLRFGFDT
jgi:hypothetical protein